MKCLLAELCNPLVPRTQLDVNLHSRLFLGPTDFNLDEYHGQMPADWHVEGLDDHVKVVGLHPEPSLDRIVGDRLRDKVDDKVDKLRFRVSFATYDRRS
jgi:hypothetical protein